MSYLVLVEHCYRGALESRSADLFDGLLGLNAQFSDVDVVLRGDAVTTALAACGESAPLRLGTPEPITLRDPRQGVRAVLAEGMAVYVDEPSLRAFGLDGAALLPGVVCLDTTRLAERWARYDGVWFV